MNAKETNLITLQQIYQKLQVGKTFFHGKIKRLPDFPNPVHIVGNRCVRYLEADVDAWILAKAGKSTSQ